jgi:hypothetical protein
MDAAWISTPAAWIVIPAARIPRETAPLFIPSSRNWSSRSRGRKRAVREPPASGRQPLDVPALPFLLPGVADPVV